jgi:hypothetical protein
MSEEEMTEEKCNCKHEEYCKIKDKKSCIGRTDPWFRPDDKIFGRTTIEISKMQGRNKDLKK